MRLVAQHFLPSKGLLIFSFTRLLSLLDFLCQVRMAFVAQGRKSSQTMWVQGSSVDWTQMAKFMAPTGNGQPCSSKAETWPPTMVVKPRSAAGHFQSPGPARSATDMPAIDAMEAALRFRGAIFISRKG